MRAPAIISRVSGVVISCVGAIIRDDQGRLLLVRRGHEPGAGLWSVPGGRIEPGETDAEALVREMREETGLEVEPGPPLGAVQRPSGDGDVIDIRDYAATVIGGTLIPGDDATEARWVSVADLGSLAVTEGLIEVLTEWGVLGQDGIDRPLPECDGKQWDDHTAHQAPAFCVARERHGTSIDLQVGYRERNASGGFTGRIR